MLATGRLARTCHNPAMSQTTSTPAARLRAAAERGPVALPGAFNALAARAIKDAGFDGCYVSGAAMSVSAGVPDVGLLTLTEFAAEIRRITDASGLPVVADADTGFGEYEQSLRTVVEYERAGAAGLHVEDQVFPKRCGHLDGKELVPCEEMCLKVEAMVSAKRDPDFLVIARTDARGVTGLDDAIVRANAYRAAGADAIFPEGLQSEAEFEAFAKGSPGLLLANMTEFGKTPFITLDRFGDLGYRLVIFPVSLLRLAMGEVVRSLEVLKETGSFESLVDRMQTRKQLYETLGYEPGQPWRYPAG
jgi:methylisocitrate lyase